MISVYKWKIQLFQYTSLSFRFFLTMTIRFEHEPTDGETFQYQNQLPKLPIPNLQDTAKRYLAALKPIQVNKRLINYNLY